MGKADPIGAEIIAMSHPLQCRCGALTGFVENENRATHSRCYCEDCQAFARFLGRDADLLDDRGGSEAIQTLPKDVVFARGVEHLACLRLSDRGLLRWYAACCGTPIGNTPPTSRLPFVGLARACLENTAPTVEQSFGPVRFCLFTSGARGGSKPKPFGGAGFMIWLIGNRLRARFTGGFRRNPFFDTVKDQPIVEAKVLTSAERDQLREGPLLA
ncbi:MAG: DUF6151 family protein [Phenylobacterium sp.]